MKLGVNIDHVATLRQARYAGSLDLPNSEPCLLSAAVLCEQAGASGITIHLRADRRHIQDQDLLDLRSRIRTKLNLEMGNTPEILAIALKARPEEVCLVPENRQEITTEGGLDAVGQEVALAPTIRALQAAGVKVSLFIEPSSEQVQAASRLGAEVVELHTGAFANALGSARNSELDRIRSAAEQAHALGLQVNAGHGINYENIALLHSVPHLEELNIGHSIVSRAIFVGLDRAVKEMLAAMSPVGKTAATAEAPHR
jgi:pyridoxine 5-phosphate synthase